MKNIFYALINIFFISFISTQRLSSINSNTTEIIVQQNKLFYIKNDNDGDNNIHVQDLSTYEEDTITITGFTKNKKLLSLNEQKFILFGYENDNSPSNFLFQIFDSNQYNNSDGYESFGTIKYNSKINIRMVNENIFLLCFFETNVINIYKLNLEDKSFNHGEKQLSNLASGVSLNTIECDSFDGENILCVFSLISSSDILYNYFFSNLQGSQFSGNYINNNFENIRATTLSKFVLNDEQKFVMCFINYDSIYRLHRLFCQILLETSNQVYIDETYVVNGNLGYTLGRKNYLNNIPIKILIYKYTIYVLSEMIDSQNKKNVILYSSSIDFGLNIGFFTGFPFSISLTDVNILVNSNKSIILFERIPDYKTNIFYQDLSINCQDFEQQVTSDSDDGEISIGNKFINQATNGKYLAFSLDKSTILLIDGNINTGGLIGEKLLNSFTSIKLKYRNTLQYTNNYYIYYSQIKPDEFIFDVPSSHYCHFKVINCHEKCHECHSEIMGASEQHQCKSCIDNYYKYNNGRNEDGYFNCYKEGDPDLPKNIFLDKNLKEFKECDKSCNECFSTYDCKGCSLGYYFLFNGNIIPNNTCFENTPDYHYLNISSNISHNNQTVKLVYKPCYSHCKTCLGDGNELNNNCLECKDGYIKYPFDERKCTLNKDNCTTPFWRLENITKNIECINKCDGYIIKNISKNMNQCVDDCRNFLNPFSEFLTLLSFNCSGEKVCITVEECTKRGLKYDIEKCYPDGDSCFYVPRTTIPEVPPTLDPLETNIIENRVIFIKTFEINKEYSDIKDRFELKQIQIYKEELKKELSLGIYLKGIDFITFSTYKDFFITIYPLETEDYVINNLFNVNNLCHGNFIKLFQNYNKKEETDQILIALIENKNNNLPINIVNYFFILFNEEKMQGELITNLTNGNNLIDISYPLYNYKHENIDEKYSTKLITTIKELNDVDENFNFFDKENSFYKDICNTNSFDKDIDMTIEDRIEEYYFQISFCENECSFKNIYDKNKNPKSLCECKLKSKLDLSEINYSFNPTNKEKKSVSNTKALGCVKEVSSSLSKNPAFWIFLIMIFITLALFISICFCAKSAIENMFKAEDDNLIEEINNDINIYNDKNKNIEKSNENKNIKLSSSYKNSINSIEANESKEYESNPKLNPPKKFPNKNESTSINIKHNSKNDNDTSLYDTELIYNYDKESGLEDIFDDIGNMPSKINNYNKNSKDIKIDNYIFLEKRKLFGKLKQSLQPLDKNDFNKYKYINTVNEINDQNLARKNISNIDLIKKEHFSSDDIKINPKNINFFSYSDIKKGLKTSKFSKLFGEESILSGNEKFLQNANTIGNKINKKLNNYENALKNNNNKKDNNNNIMNNSDISEKKKYGQNSQMNNLLRIKKKSLGNSSYKNSLNASINSENKLLNNKLKTKEENREIIYNKNRIFSSSSSETDNTQLIIEKKKNLFYFYCDYFIRREIFLLTFYHKYNNVSIFFRLPTFFVVIGFIFMVNCLFLTENEIHKRYEYYNDHGKMNEFKYAFEYNFGKCALIGLISIIFKMICIKLVYFVTFKIPNKIKEDIFPLNKKKLDQFQLKEIHRKKRKYLNRYKKRSILFMIIVLILLIVFAYVSIFYIGIFKHSFFGVLMNFIISVIISFIFCAFLCFIVSIFYRGGCLKIFNVLKIIY